MYLRLLVFALSSLALAGRGLVPLVADGGGEHLLVANEGETRTIVLRSFGLDGTPLEEVSLSLAAGESLRLPAAEMLPEGTSHFTCDSAGVRLGLAGAEQAGAYLWASHDTASSWVLDGADLGGAGSQMVVNRGEGATDVWAYQRNEQGKILAAARIAEGLAPMARVGFAVADLFEARDGVTYLVAGSRPLTVVAVARTHNPDGRMKERVAYARAKSESSSHRDDRGVWFIEGGSLYDAFEMMGYNIAFDRLWQSEIFRRTGRGRLAELFGAQLASQDVSVRATGYSDAELDDYYADSHEDTQTVISAYVAGFNRRIAEVNADPLGSLPFEFKALGLSTVEDWSIHDVMAWMTLLQRNFSALGSLGFGQVQNALDLLDLVGAHGPFVGSAIFSDTSWRNDPAAPVMVPDEGAGKRADDGEAALRELRALLGANKKLPSKLDGFREMVAERRARDERNTELLKKVGGFVKGGSYAWAIAGSKTASGNPTIYSGPQMGFSAPAIVVEGSIRTDDLNISGMTVPGIPVIIIGRTPHHAWSMQVGHTATWDFYVEPAEAVSLHHVETVKVQGGEDIQVPVFRSGHGPVVAQEPFILSWKYSAWGREWRIAEGNLAMARAESMEAFGEGVANLGVTQHFCYADRDGNIAYWHSGFNPIRPPGEYRIPQGFLGAPLEWEGFQAPVHDANPAQGFYAGWNNKARADQVDYSGTFRYGPYHRAHVPQTVIREQGTMTFEDIKEVAVNIAATQAFPSGSGAGGGNLWVHVADAFGAAVAALPSDARQEVMDLMAAWDGHYVAGGREAWITGTDVSEAWKVGSLWIEKVADAVFADEVGFMTGRTTRFNMLVRELNSESPRRNHYRRYVRNLTDAAAPGTLNEIIVAALDEALAELGSRPWGLGERGVIEYGNTFGLPIPPTPWGARSTYAHVVEYGPTGPTRIESMFPLGESGFINVDAAGLPVFDLHYFSMKEIFDSFAPRSFPLFEETAP